MNNLLSSSAIFGAILLVFLFIVCFLGVHLFIYFRQKSVPSNEEKPPQEEPIQPEPIYYIVEKKKKRRRDNYCEPKRIDFK